MKKRAKDLLQLRYGLPWWLSGQESACYAGEAGSSLGGQDPLEEEMATYSSILAWREEPGGL